MKGGLKMKEEMKKQLIKDIVIAIIAWVVVAILFIALNGQSIALSLLMGFMCAGIPFGWRWSSKIFSAISLYTIALKVILSIFLGWIALPVIIIKDIIAIAKAD